jgi:hypothetical protein
LPGGVTLEAMDPHDVLTRLHRLERLLAGLPAEANALWDDLRVVKQHLKQRQAALDALEHESALLREDLARCAGELGDTQRRGVLAAGQLVALRRLQSTLERGAMLLALEEVLASLVGCEEFALLELVDGRLRIVHAVGIAKETLEALQLGEGLLVQCCSGAGLWLDELKGARDRASLSLTACVPLEADGRRVGTLALFRLLEHKLQLEQNDVELLELLRVHVGVALQATRGSGLGQAS